MWGKKVKTAEATIVETPIVETKLEPKAAQKRASSAISSETKVLGSIVSTGDLVVDGSVEGDIRCSLFTIGKDGVVHGNIIAETATIRGKIIGNVTARTIMLAGNSVVEGDLTHSVLIIEEGGAFEGRSRRVADPLSEASLAIENSSEEVKSEEDSSENTDSSETDAKTDDIKENDTKEAKAKSGKKSKENGDEPAISKEIKEAFAVN